MDQLDHLLVVAEVHGKPVFCFSTLLTSAHCFQVAKAVPVDRVMNEPVTVESVMHFSLRVRLGRSGIPTGCRP
jgi:hypothetical protein